MLGWSGARRLAFVCPMQRYCRSPMHPRLLPKSPVVQLELRSKACAWRESGCSSQAKRRPRARLPVASADAGVRGRRAVVSGAGVAALITIETNGERREITSKTDSPTSRPARGAQCRRAGHAKRSGDGRGNHVRHCDIRGKRSHARSAQGMAERGGLSRACVSAARDVARRRRGSRDRQRLHAQTGGCAAAT